MNRDERLKGMDLYNTTMSFLYSNGGYFDGYTELLIQKCPEGATITRTNTQWVFDRVRTGILAQEEWNYFLYVIYNCFHVMEWDEIYYNQDILDGNQWSMKIGLEGDISIDFFGSNSYPPNWYDFVEYMNTLIEKCTESKDEPLFG